MLSAKAEDSVPQEIIAGVFCQTRTAYLEHDTARAELKKLMPGDAKEAIGHGVRAKRTKSGAVSFDLHAAEDVLNVGVQWRSPPLRDGPG